MGGSSSKKQAALEDYDADESLVSQGTLEQSQRHLFIDDNELNESLKTLSSSKGSKPSSKGSTKSSLASS